MKIHLYLSAIVCLSVFTITNDASAIVQGQIDDFQDGTTQGWSHGGRSPIPPVNSPDNGPMGTGDHALLVATNGNSGGAGSLLVTFNETQWSGDYLAAGVNNITFQANNLSGRDVTLRLAAEGAGGRISTTTGHLLSAASGWQSLSFDITAADWTLVGGTDISATLGMLNELRIVDNVFPSFMGSAGAAELLVDNIRAIPEPNTCYLAIASALAIIARRRREISEI